MKRHLQRFSQKYACIIQLSIQSIPPPFSNLHETPTWARIEKIQSQLKLTTINATEFNVYGEGGNKILFSKK